MKVRACLRDPVGDQIGCAATGLSAGSEGHGQAPVPRTAPQGRSLARGSFTSGLQDPRTSVSASPQLAVHQLEQASSNIGAGTTTSTPIPLGSRKDVQLMDGLRPLSPNPG